MAKLSIGDLPVEGAELDEAALSGVSGGLPSEYEGWVGTAKDSGGGWSEWIRVW